MASAPARWLYLALGWVFFVVGVAGAILPIVPATPFFLLALWGFSRSSPRLERWLLEHRWFGASLRAWRAHRVIPLRGKLVAWGSMAMSLGWMIYGGTAWWIIALSAALMGYGAWFVASCPSRPPPAKPAAAPATPTEQPAPAPAPGK